MAMSFSLRRSRSGRESAQQKAWQQVEFEHELQMEKSPSCCKETVLPLSSSLDEDGAVTRSPTCRAGSESEDLGHEDLKWVLQQLAHWNLEELMGEVAYNIFSAKFVDVRKARGIAHWNYHDVCAWLQSLSFLSSIRDQIPSIVECECLDGEAVMEIVADHKLGEILRVDYVCNLVLELIVTSWRDVDSNFVLPASVPLNLLGVLTGYVCDLRGLSKEVAGKIIETNQSCITTGKGSIYGQLVVLGYKEYRMVGEKWCSFGNANTKYLLTRRKLPNGCKPCSEVVVDGSASTSYSRLPNCGAASCRKCIQFNCRSPSATAGDGDMQEYSLHFEPDPLTDCFQIGRAAYSSNDFVVPGELHYGPDCLPSGPVSRRSCRVVCERLPPFQCYVLAGGFSEEGELAVKGAQYADGVTDVDGFTTFGVKLFQPEVGEWQEISVRGRTYALREESFSPPRFSKANPLQNRLTNGSLIDIGGIVLMYQDPIAMSRQQQPRGDEVIAAINALQPQCPVLFGDLTFHWMDSQSRARNAVLNAKNDSMYNYTGYGPVHVPATDLSEVCEDQRVYVFPACGHVFGYHKSLEHNFVCPLCRQIGPFVPLAFSFEKAICSGAPTHVFNPCGHVVSESTAKHWKQTVVHNRHVPFHRLCAICPFCATELNASQPYSRLQVQTAGTDWKEWCSKFAEQEEASQTFSKTGESIDVNSARYLEELVRAQSILWRERCRNSQLIERVGNASDGWPRDEAGKAEDGSEDSQSLQSHRRFVHFPVFPDNIS